MELGIPRTECMAKNLAVTAKSMTEQIEMLDEEPVTNPGRPSAIPPPGCIARIQSGAYDELIRTLCIDHRSSPQLSALFSHWEFVAAFTDLKLCGFAKTSHRVIYGHRAVMLTARGRKMAKARGLCGVAEREKGERR